MSAHHGGPAFPSAFTNDGDRNTTAPDGSIVPPGFTVPMQGMTLRQWYAGMALAGYFASFAGHPSRIGAQMSAVADECFRAADCMLHAGARS